MEIRPAKSRFYQAETGGNGLKWPAGELQMRSGPRGRGFESRHSDQRRRGRCFAVSGLSFSPLFAAFTELLPEALHFVYASQLLIIGLTSALFIFLF
jgi:hypothetical protein